MSTKLVIDRSDEFQQPPTLMQSLRVAYHAGRYTAKLGVYVAAVGVALKHVTVGGFVNPGDILVLFAGFAAGYGTLIAGLAAVAARLIDSLNAQTQEVSQAND